MLRRPLLLLFLTFPVLAQGGPRQAQVLLEQARRLVTNPPLSMSQEEVLDQAFQILARAADADPTQWGALLEMGLNRCMKADLNRHMLQNRLELLRTQGRSPDDVKLVEAQGLDFIDNRVVVAAYQSFLRMTEVMSRTHTRDRDWIDFANAMMKFARGEYLQAQRGAPGAIDDLKALMKRKWQPARCADLLARIYLRLGADEFREENFTKAQEYWDDGLNFAVNDGLRRDLLTNKAGAHATRNEYGLAEKVLRDLLRKEPSQPAHWKNLGLVLGYQNRLDPALFAYRRARELSREFGREDEIALQHGNAWLKAAMIHGKLKEADGDLPTAWRLFLEYRSMFGDDYNFCFNFGEFCFQMGRYDLAWTFLRRAAEIHPFCPNPWLLLVRVAQRMTDGTKEEQEARREQVKRDLEEAQQRYAPSHESQAVKRICGGLREAGEERLVYGPVPKIDPDPLAGAELGAPMPDWIAAKAAEREPHELYDPTVEEFLGLEPPTTTDSGSGSGGAEGATGGARLWWIVGGALVAAFLAGILFARRRRAA